jgi:hypothetical protein
MYKNSCLASIRVNNRTLREKHNKTVFLPFNSQYSIFLRNDNTRRAYVSIKIDGTDVLGGDGLILNGYGYEINLERFLTDGNLNNGRRFKFVKASDERVQDPSSPENGLVEIEFWLEKPINIVYYPTPFVLRNDEWRISSWPISSWPWYSGHTGSYNHKTLSGAINCSTNYSATTIGAGSATKTMATTLPDSGMKESFSSDIGATVEGNKSSQSFVNTTFGEKEYPSTVIKLWLRGLDREITTADKLYCTSCGKKLNFDYEFCPKCGTEVVIE